MRGIYDRDGEKGLEERYATEEGDLNSMLDSFFGGLVVSLS